MSVDGFDFRYEARLSDGTNALGETSVARQSVRERAIARREEILEKIGKQKHEARLRRREKFKRSFKTTQERVSEFPISFGRFLAKLPVTSAGKGIKRASDRLGYSWYSANEETKLALCSIAKRRAFKSLCIGGAADALILWGSWSFLHTFTAIISSAVLLTTHAMWASVINREDERPQWWQKLSCLLVPVRVMRKARWWGSY